MRGLMRSGAAPAFALAMFSSALLIFMLQPMFGRMATPLLGGSPAVWNASMAFFQGALLVGYVYAHALARLKDMRLQAGVHALVFIAAWLVLPVHVSAALGAPSSEHPTLWLLGVLTLSVGAPFAAMSATAPLLQSWYARTDQEDAGDPYYLYAASNLGSFAGLLAYPVVIEPWLGLQAQSFAWSGLYALSAALILIAGSFALMGHARAAEPLTAGPAPSWRQRLYWIAASAAPSALTLGVTLHITTDVASAPMLWVAPLALYLLTFVIAFGRGAERYTNIVSMLQPFAIALLLLSYTVRSHWIALLVCNLAGFFLSALVCHMALARTRPPAGRLTEFYFLMSLGGVLGGAFAAFVAPVVFNDVYEFPLALAAAALFLPRGAPMAPRMADIAVAAGLAIAGMCLLLQFVTPHQAVLVGAAVASAAAFVAAAWDAEGKPSPWRLAFFGAAAASALVSVLALANMDSIWATTPRDGDIDLRVFAQPWATLLSLSALATLGFCLFASAQKRRERVEWVTDAALGVAIPLLFLVLAFALVGQSLDAAAIVVVALGVLAIGLFFNRARPVIMSGFVLVAFAIVFMNETRHGRTLEQVRSFFGVIKVREYSFGGDNAFPPMRVLVHGTTTHGAQIPEPEYARVPLTYYNSETALAEAILAGLSLHDGNRLALIGLGTGSTACLMRPEDRLTIFEIDPTIVRMATHADSPFTFVSLCQPEADVQLGDARLRITDEPDGAFDVIVVDAFSSDAIPAHLLTAEALALYLDKTSDNGVVVLHLSNRNLALVSEAARAVDALGAASLWRASRRVDVPYAPVFGGLPASVMIVAKRQETLDLAPLQSDEWRALPTPPGRAWSDDYVNIARALWDSANGVEECRLYPDIERCVEDNVDIGPEAPR